MKSIKYLELESRSKKDTIFRFFVLQVCFFGIKCGTQLLLLLARRDDELAALIFFFFFDNKRKMKLFSFCLFPPLDGSNVFEILRSMWKNIAVPMIRPTLILIN